MKKSEEVIKLANNYDKDCVAYICNNENLIALPVLNFFFISEGFAIVIPIKHKVFFDSIPTYVAIKVWNKVKEIEVKGKMVNERIEDKDIKKLKNKMRKDDMDNKEVEIVYFEFIEINNIALRKYGRTQSFVSKAFR